jgi:DNA invertase Pin-like site-specific DNA recombinase
LASYLRNRAEAREAGDALSNVLANRDDSTPTVWRVRDRLSDEQVTTLVARFQSGELQTELAAEYGVSRSTIKRLLARHGARRNRPRSQSDA